MTEPPIPDPNLYPVYTFLDPRMYTKRKKNLFDNGFEPDWGIMGYRPPSPYPYAKANPIPSYEHRLQNMQEPHIPGDPWLFASPSDERNGWIPATAAINIPQTGYHLGLVQERHGPDVFITDSYSYVQPSAAIDLTGVASDLVSFWVNRGIKGFV